MDGKKHIQTLFHEIEVYHGHGLFFEAMEKCRELTELIQNSDQIHDKENLVAAMAERIRDLENDARKFEEVGSSAQLSAAQQDLIKQLFSVGEGSDAAALQGATALLVFGQFERALEEFTELINRGSLRVDAAKNALRCHVGLSSLDDAVKHYQQWLVSGQFSSGELKRIRSFLQDILKKNGVEKTLSSPEETTETKELQTCEEEFIDISSIEIPIDDESLERKELVLDVSFQIGNMVSVIIANSDQNIVDKLKINSKLCDVKFNSSVVNFRDSCVVSAVKQIDSGPQKGNYTLLIEIPDT